MLRNKPETMIYGLIGTQGRIEYLKAFGAVVALCIEVKLKVRNDERLKIIALAIAECDGKFCASLAYVTSRTPPGISTYPLHFYRRLDLRIFQVWKKPIFIFCPWFLFWRSSLPPAWPGSTRLFVLDDYSSFHSPASLCMWDNLWHNAECIYCRLEGVLCSIRRMGEDARFKETWMGTGASVSWPCVGSI